MNKSKKDVKFGDVAPSEYPGERLGLPSDGPGSMARLMRRVVAIMVDWAAALTISHLLNGSSLVTLLLFALIQMIFIPTLGGSPGHLLFGMRVISLDGRWVGMWRPVLRTILLCLVIPVVVWDSDLRGFHDKIAGTALVRR